MKVVLNGEVRVVQSSGTVQELLHEVGRDTVPCAVEVNCNLVPKKQHGVHQLHEGDRIEVVTLVGGG